MRFFYDNVIDASGVDLTVSSEDTTLVGANVTHPFRTKVWRTGTTLTNESLIFDLQSAQSVTSCFILNHTIGASDTVKIQGNDTDSWGGPTVDEVITHNTGTMSAVFTGGSHRYWRLLITKNAASTAVDVGRVWLSAWSSIAAPAQTGYSEGLTDISETSRAVAGQTYSYAKDSFRTYAIGHNVLSETDYSTVKTVADNNGTHTPLFIQVLTTSPMDEYVYVKFTSLIGRKYVTSCTTEYSWQTQMSFAEEL